MLNLSFQSSLFMCRSWRLISRRLSRLTVRNPAQPSCRPHTQRGLQGPGRGSRAPTEVVEGDTVARAAKTGQRVGTPCSRADPLWPQALVDSLGGQGGADAVPLKTGAELQEGSAPGSRVCSVLGTPGGRSSASGAAQSGCASPALSVRSSLLRSSFLSLYCHFTLHNVSYPGV